VTDTPRDDPAVVRSTRHWQTTGMFVLFLLVLAFPVYRATDGSRRDSALASQNQALLSQGHGLWGTNCMSCHGVMGQGATAPALNSKEFLSNVNDAQIHGIIAGGIPGTAMPTWLNDDGGPLTDEQIVALVTYLRSWEKNAPSVPNWRTPTP
jgi:mono/diheme cytochrome c family protein